MEDICIEKVNIAEKFKQIRDYWKLYIVAELNGQYVKLDKLKGVFIWHCHKDEYEMFLVVKGRFRIEFRNRHLWASWRFSDMFIISHSPWVFLSRLFFTPLIQ
jgi:hypothetical protein